MQNWGMRLLEKGMRLLEKEEAYRKAVKKEPKDKSIC